ncbi:uncharacterized protein LOC135824541 [Sycon ciliatum]|uniref:uncharacterized protein LOC135824541 n=1 Tax=Sycon ciliatum TaxID=27933 RepID=UPI0031F6E85F
MPRSSKIHPMPAHCPTSSSSLSLYPSVFSSWEDVAMAGQQLTYEQQDIVQSSWQALSQDLEGFGCQVLNRLEQLSPEAYSAYTMEAPISDVTSDYASSIPSNGAMATSTSYSFLQQPCGIASFRCHAKRTMETYGMVVFGLEDMEAVYPLLKSTGRRLARRGVLAQHAHALSLSMLGMLEQVFVTEWCTPWQSAWSSLTALVEYGHLAGMHHERSSSMAAPSATQPLHLPLCPDLVPDQRNLSSPSAGSWSASSAGSSFSLSPQSLSSSSTSSSSSSARLSTSAFSCGSDDSSPPKCPSSRDLSWATSRASVHAWAPADDLVLPSRPARQQNWCINIPALLRSSKKHRRRSDPIPSSKTTAGSSSSSSGGSKHSTMPKWLARSPMLRSKFSHDHTAESGTNTLPAARHSTEVGGQQQAGRRSSTLRYAPRR